MRPSGFHHLAIQVHDLAAAERFYSGLLGLAVIKRWPFPDGRPGERSLWLQIGEGFLALEKTDEPPAPPPFRHPRAGLHLLALRIAPAERAAWEERFAQAGVPVVHRSAFTLYVQDPEGNRVGLSHHPHEA